MATVTAIAYRRARALRLAANASQALAAKFDLIEQKQTKAIRDPQLAQVALIEQFADTLKQLAIKTEAATEAEMENINDFGQTTPEGQGAAQPNEDGFDPSMPEGAKGAEKKAAKEAVNADAETSGSKGGKGAKK